MIDVARAVAEPARDRRLASLDDLLIEIRNHGRRLTPDEGEALLAAWWAEAARPQFDRPAYAQLWRILEHAPPMEKLAAAADRSIADREMAYRGCAARYLLNAYPERLHDFRERHRADPDPEVRDAIDRALRGQATWGVQCADCLKMVERVAQSNRSGPSDLDLSPIIGPHPTLRVKGEGQPLHIHESTATLFQCETCHCWWDICQWYGVGYLYIDARSPGWAEEWLHPSAGAKGPSKNTSASPGAEQPRKD